MSKKRSLGELDSNDADDAYHPKKRRRTEDGIKFNVESYYIDNCQSIFLSLCLSLEIPYLVAQTIAEFATSIQVKCNDCNLFEASLNEKQHWKLAWNSGLKYVVQDENYQFDKEYYIINPNETMDRIKILCAKCELNAHCKLCDYKGEGINQGDIFKCYNCNGNICKSCCNINIDERERKHKIQCNQCLIKENEANQETMEC